MKDIKEKIWSGAISFFVLALLCFFGARALMEVWPVLLIAAAICHWHHPLHPLQEGQAEVLGKAPC